MPFALLPGRAPAFASLLLAATLACHAGTLANGFVWDDEKIVVAAAQSADQGRLARALSSPDEVKPYYRPLTRASFLVDARIWGLVPWAFHLVNLALHAVNVLVLFWLVRYLFGQEVLAFLASLLLAVHPLGTETVAFVSARNNLFALLFLQLAVGTLALAIDRRSRWWSLGSGVMWFLALASKESSGAGLLLLGLYAAWPARTDGRRVRDRLSRLIPHLGFLGVYMLLRRSALGGALGTESAFRSLGDAARLNLVTIPRYLELILFPLRLNVFHPVREGSGGVGAWQLVAWVLVGGGLVLLVLQRSRVSVSGLAWFAVNFLPVANLVVIPSATMAERFMYLPSVGLWVIAADQAIRLARRVGLRERGVAIGAATLAVALGARTVARNRDWRDDVALFRSSVSTSPGSVDAWFNLGTAYRERGDLEGARAAWQQGIALDPGDPRVLTQLGTLAAVNGDYRGAEKFLRSALESKEVDPLARLNLAKILERTGRAREAEIRYLEYLESVREGPDADIDFARAALDRLREARGESR